MSLGRDLPMPEPRFFDIAGLSQSRQRLLYLLTADRHAAGQLHPDRLDRISIPTHGGRGISLQADYFTCADPALKTARKAMS